MVWLSLYPGTLLDQTERVYIMMKKILVSSALVASMAAFGASAADLISKDEAHHFKLSYIGNVSVSSSGGQVSSPSDLHEKLSQLADEKGGKYYVIIAAREHGPNFDAVAEVFK